MINKMKLGDILLKLGLITKEDLEKILDLQKSSTQKNEGVRFLGELLLRERKLTKEQLIPVLEYQLNVKYMDLRRCDIDTVAVRLITEQIARKYRLVPISMRGGKVQVVMADPLDIMAKDDLKLMTGMDLQIYLGFWEEIEWAINTNYTTAEVAEQAMEELEEQGGGEEEENRDEDAEVSRAPIVRLINSILEQAVRIKASDIHIEPMEHAVKVRLRVDGDLQEMMTTPRNLHSAIVARIKILSGLDIAEKRIPQDGGIKMNVLGRPIDFRVSLLPLVYGEKVVMRILDRSSIMVTKEQLGFTPHNVKLFDGMIKAPEGIILLSGPTGSGKTTTLYAVLKEITKPNLNVITVEDPVEYRLEGVHQVQVNAKSGLTFAAGLRSILRQDPDVVMVGEIRDSETAQIAVRAAITGHVVLSTIHTNDTVSTVLRLVDMGIEVFMVASALIGVVAQRLVKRICTACKTARNATQEEQAALGASGPVKVHEGKGCHMCGGTGYAGRIAVHEILVMDRELRAMVTRGDPVDTIKEKAREKGLRTLNESCRELVLSGVTSVSEMLRVTHSVDF